MVISVTETMTCTSVGLQQACYTIRWPNGVPDELTSFTKVKGVSYKDDEVLETLASTQNLIIALN